MASQGVEMRTECAYRTCEILCYRSGYDVLPPTDIAGFYHLRTIVLCVFEYLESRARAIELVKYLHAGEADPRFVLCARILNRDPHCDYVACERIPRRF